MDPAELDRWTCFDLEPSVEDWLDHSKDKVMPIVWDFVNQNRAHLEFKGENEPNKIYPSRRSWFRLNDCLAKGKLLDGRPDNFKGNLPVVYDLACGFVGFEAAVQFRDFAEKYEKQVTVDDIFEGRHHLTDGWSINDHTSMVEKIIASGRMKEELDENTINNISAWCKKMPGEAMMKMWKSVGPQQIKNAVKFHKAMGDYIVRVMTGDAANTQTATPSKKK